MLDDEVQGQAVGDYAPVRVQLEEQAGMVDALFLLALSGGEFNHAAPPILPDCRSVSLHDGVARTGGL